MYSNFNSLKSKHHKRIPPGDNKGISVCTSMTCEDVSIKNKILYIVILKKLFNPLGPRILLKHALLFPGFNIVNYKLCLF